MKKLLLLLVVLITGITSAQNYEGVVGSYLSANRSALGLQPEDVSDFVINAQSYSQSMNVDNVYVSQRFEGIEILNSSSPMAIKNNEVVVANLSFTAGLQNKINTVTPAITAETAINKAANQLGLSSPSGLILEETINSHSFVYSNGSISLEEIPVRLVFQPSEENSLRLAWDLSIYLTDRSHWYSVRIDAVTGNLIATDDWVVNCTIGTGPHAGHNNEMSVLEAKHPNPYRDAEIIAGSNSYRVFPLPLESPNDGPDQLVSDPSDATASPFGWHDINGIAGPEFTRTKGNNVDAHDDINGNNDVVFGPDGGPTLEFDFPYGLPQQPINFLDAATTNLFYWNNIMHDVMYQYGFDEPSGNFQQNNYGNGGAQSDFVFAQSQDGGGLNNANFGTPPDGQNGVMQMFLWSAPGEVLGTFLTVNNGPLAGQYLAYDSNFGGTPLPTTPITADLVVMEDDDAGASTDPYDGCDNVTNAGALNGNIAVVRRGECNFTVKVASAEAAGAIAVVVVNNVPTDPIPMGGTGAGIGIPAIMIFEADGEPIITSLLNGDTINATLEDDGSGDDPFQRDGDLDNVIIAHEYGHGVSNRLTGGPGQAGCLQNDEQMGEGWSDYLGLMLTMKPGDQGDDVRGIGTYVLGQSPQGTGLPDRNAPYSTDFAINDFTYGDTNAGVSQPHGIGFVWATMLWDLTWAFIDQDGYDPDIYNGTGGNNKALQLVIDGMKLQICSPGFEDARDAILQADELANGGANRCLIWGAFAARGLGVDADQGSRFSRSDQVENFDIPEGPDCTLSVGETNSYDNNFIIYPNPSNGEINIRSVVAVGDVTISIFDLNGRKVFSTQADLQNIVSINAGSLDAGVYVVKIDGNNYTHSAKLLIQ